MAGTNNWRLTLGGEPIMDPRDWRAQYRPEYRKRIVNKIMDVLKASHCLSDEDEIHELLKVARSLEQKTWAGATSQPDYQQKIFLKLVSVKSQLQEEVYEKIKIMKEMYLPELIEIYEKLVTDIQQYDSLPEQPKSDRLEKMEICKVKLERSIEFLQVSKSNISPNFKKNWDSYEQQVLLFIYANRPRKTWSSLRPGEPLPRPPPLHSVPQPQSQVTQVRSFESQINSLASSSTAVE